ncbi:hypothetical protein N7513_008349 [Penicillium frequentans]|nr:hypothetical protein N7513_008349 [Penicillium glabrum]
MCALVLNIRRAHGSDPTQLLQQALDAFEEALTGEEKQQYHSNQSVPGVLNVIQFVANVDAQNNSTERRCVAPRLLTFLEAMQQFSGVVDTFVSSNPPIAALVWGGVKTAIMTANNMASYFEEVTRTIMFIGKICPTFQEFGKLYPGCLNLQSALCEYYAIIIRLCTKIIIITRRPAFANYISSIVMPFASEFKPFLDELNESRKKIEQQILLASLKAEYDSQKLLEYESIESTKFRLVARDFYKQASKQHDQIDQYQIDAKARDIARIRCQIRGNLSTINSAKPWKQALRQRIPTTAEWILQEPVFHKWRDGPESSILWCSGTMGVGKTILVCNMIAQLHTALSAKRNEAVSYHVCCADMEDSLSARNIIGSLTRQLLDTQIEHALGIRLLALNKARQDFDTTDVTDFLLSNLDIDQKSFVMIDGINECNTETVREVVENIERLCQRRPGKFKILYSGRPGMEDELFRSTGAAIARFKISVTETKVASDMKIYIDTRLDNCLETKQLKLGDPKVILHIKRALQDGSSGMFLWTRLFIEELCTELSDKAILAALEHPPRGMAEIFDRKVRRMYKGRDKDQVLNLLQYCGVMKRPLVSSEYQELLSVSPDQKSLDRQNFPNDMKKLVSDSCGLLFMDEEESTIHYIHPSVKQHLFSQNGLAKFDMTWVDQRVGLLCMVYLDFINFKGDVSRRRQGWDTPVSPVQIGAISINHSRSTTSQAAQKLLSHYPKLQHLSSGEIERKAMDILRMNYLNFDEDKRIAFPFLPYATNSWFMHLIDISPSDDDRMWPLFCRCIEEDKIPAHRPWKQNKTSPSHKENIPEAVRWLLAHGHGGLLWYLSETQAPLFTIEVKQYILSHVARRDQHRFTNVIIRTGHNSPEILNHGLFCAALSGCHASTETLLAEGSDANTAVGGETALFAATRSGHLQVVKRLIAANADVNRKGIIKRDHIMCSQTPLQMAAAQGHLEIVDELITANADLNVPSNEATPLHLAAKLGHAQVVTRLLASDADVLSLDSLGKTPLQAAADSLHLDVVERLLGIHLDLCPQDAPIAFHAAVAGGSLALVERLIAVSVNVNASPEGGDGRSALQVAAAKGHTEIVERLIAANARLDWKGKIGMTALQIAAERLHIQVVDKIMAAQSKLNASDGVAALHAAAVRGHMGMLEKLIAGGVDVNVVLEDSDGRSALQAAAAEGHTKVVERLIAANAKLDWKGKIGMTALQIAAERSHIQVVDRIMAAQNTLSTDDGVAALHVAAAVGHIDMVKTLIAANFDVNAVAPEQRAALHEAAGRGHSEIVETLIAAGANVNMPIYNAGDTPLQAAVRGGHSEVVDMLIAANANVNAPPFGWDKKTALQAAFARGHSEIVDNLKHAGAKR